ncbi:MAG TPA: segregation/condensation protein A [Deinococcales bacterium]|nr:segregation/condensation protein A [Deinococcales bacterium]
MPDPTGEAFQAEFDGFTGSLADLSAALRSGRIEPGAVPLLALTRQVLERFAALRASLDAASEALPALAAVIELKTRLLLPRPALPAGGEEDDPERPLAEVLAGVEALQQLEGAIHFLRDRRRERSRLLAATPPPLGYPRPAKPAGSLGQLVAAARRRALSLPSLDLALDRLTLADALERLRALARRAWRFFLHEVPASSWEERAVTLAAFLEGVRAGELEGEQEEAYGPIRVTAAQVGAARANETREPVA